MSSQSKSLPSKEARKSATFDFSHTWSILPGRLRPLKVFSNLTPRKGLPLMARFSAYHFSIALYIFPLAPPFPFGCLLRFMAWEKLENSGILTWFSNLQEPIVLMTGASLATSILLSRSRRSLRRLPSSGSPAEVGPGSATVAIGAQVPDELDFDVVAEAVVEALFELWELVEEASLWLAEPVGESSPGGSGGGSGGGNPSKPGPPPPPPEQNIASTQPVFVHNGLLQT